MTCSALRTSEQTRQPSQSHSRAGACRRGLSLLEVVIALAIFVGAMAAVGQLISAGVRGALRSRHQAEASILAEAKLGEVVAGVIPLQTTQAAFTDDQNWTWSLAVTAGPVPGLMRAEITVQRKGSNPAANITYRLARYVRDPQIYFAAEQEEAAREAEDQGGSTTP